MIQASLKVYIFLIILRLCKRIFRCHAQLGAYIKTNYSNVKHCSGPPLTEALGAYVRPRLCRYRYLSRPPYYLNFSCPKISPAPFG